MSFESLLTVAHPTLTRALCKVIVGGYDGISTEEMKSAFAAADIVMIGNYSSKTEVAYHALVNEQNFAKSSQPLERFIFEALSPARFIKDPQKRQRIVSEVDTVLRTYKFSITVEGHITPVIEGATGVDALTQRLKRKVSLTRYPCGGAEVL